MFFDLLAGKAFLARSIKLCLVDNQQSSGVTVVGFESCLVGSRITNVEIFINRIYQLLFWLCSWLYLSIGIRSFRFIVRYNLVCLRFIFVYYLESTKSPKIFQFLLSYHLFCLAILFLDLLCWVCVLGWVYLLVLIMFVVVVQLHHCCSLSPPLSHPLFLNNKSKAPYYLTCLASRLVWSLAATLTLDRFPATIISPTL